MVKRKLLVGGYLLLCNLLFILYLQKSAATFPVMMTDEGYSSNIITIQPGQKVIWRNTGNKARWPASNNHPTHTNYPSEEKGCLGSDLDACRPMNTGEEYSYVFDKPGSWGIHDHLNPGSIMVVEVANVQKGFFGKAQILAKKLFNKQNSSVVPTPEKFRGLTYGVQLSFLEGYAPENPEGAWKLIKQAFIINGQVVNDAHEFSHIIGNASYRKSGISGVDICDTSFAYGCYHGVADAAITERGAQAVSEIEVACTDALPSDQVTSCYHGIGHGAAGIHELKIKPALLACDKMKSENRGYCYDGVFMEHATALGAQGINRNDPWSLCASVENIYHMACGKYQPARLQSIGMSLGEIITSCLPAPSSVLEEHCFRASGFIAVGAGKNNIEEIISYCIVAKLSDGVYWCLIGAANVLTFQAYENWQINAPKLCDRVNKVELKQECISIVHSVSQRESR